MAGPKLEGTSDIVLERPSVARGMNEYRSYATMQFMMRDAAVNFDSDEFGSRASKDAVFAKNRHIMHQAGRKAGNRSMFHVRKRLLETPMCVDYERGSPAALDGVDGGGLETRLVPFVDLPRTKSLLEGADALLLHPEWATEVDVATMDGATTDGAAGVNSEACEQRGVNSEVDHPTKEAMAFLGNVVVALRGAEKVAHLNVTAPVLPIRIMAKTLALAHHMVKTANVRDAHQAQAGFVRWSHFAKTRQESLKAGCELAAVACDKRLVRHARSFAGLQDVADGEAQDDVSGNNEDNTPDPFFVLSDSEDDQQDNTMAPGGKGPPTPFVEHVLSGDAKDSRTGSEHQQDIHAHVLDLKLVGYKTGDPLPEMPLRRYKVTFRAQGSTKEAEALVNPTLNTWVGKSKAIFPGYYIYLVEYSFQDRSGSQAMSIDKVRTAPEMVEDVPASNAAAPDAARERMTALVSAYSSSRSGATQDDHDDDESDAENVNTNGCVDLNTHALFVTGVFEFGASAHGQ